MTEHQASFLVYAIVFVIVAAIFIWDYIDAPKVVERNIGAVRDALKKDPNAGVR